jgi:hypothetical protein
VLSHNDLYYPFFACNQMTQSAAVNIQEAAEQSGCMRLQGLFDMAIETFRAIIRK